MIQTRLRSLFEIFLNYAIGYTVGLLTNQFILPLIINYEPNIGKSALISIVYTAISIIRSYIVRRVFNKKDSKRIEEINK